MISKFTPPIATSKFARRAVVEVPEVAEPEESTTEKPKRHRRTRAEMAALRGEPGTAAVVAQPRTKYAAMGALTESKEAVTLLKTAERLEAEAAKARAKARHVGAEEAYKAATMAVAKLKKDLVQAESALVRATDLRAKAVA